MTSDVLQALSLNSAYRYAIYFAPALHDPWWHAGSQWLGRDAFSGALCSQPLLSGLSVGEQQALTAAPRRYGWHATLKAPFVLAEGVQLADLRLALRALSWHFTPFTLPPLRVVLLDDFLALVPTEQCTELDFIARACVSQLHALAAPLSSADLARRRAAKLSDVEDAMLVAWGYPYVMDQFRFHMSLTGSLVDVPPPTIDVVHHAAQHWFATLPRCAFTSIALFAEPAPGADFLLLEHIRLATKRE
jgi:putative phosphonate metabolism protein